MKRRLIEDKFGVEFYDVDVRHMSDGELAEARAAQDEHGVIFFRDQQLEPEQHIAFAERWGEIVINRFFEHVEGFDRIAMVRKEPDHKTVVGEVWHTDHSYDRNPARGSILYAREVPSSGGDTWFANMYLAFETLSPGLKKTLEGLNAVHSSSHVFGEQAVRASEPDEDRFHSFDQATQTNVHPVVIVHPLSGRKALYVNPQFTLCFEGWTEEESGPLLAYLYAHAVRPEFVIHYQWHKDAIAFWDNRATWHQAQNDYPGERRLMHRITLAGCPIDGPGN